MRKVKFKTGEYSFVFQGQTITPEMLTIELYDYMVGIAPSIANHFDLLEDSPKEEAKSKK